MAQPARQNVRTLGSGSVGGGHRSKKSKWTMSIAAPLAVASVFLVIVIWVVVCVRFYLHGMHTPNETLLQQNRKQMHNFVDKSKSILQNLRAASGSGIPVGDAKKEEMLKKVKKAETEKKKAPAATVDAPFPEHYMAFSTACSSSQDWQSYMFFYHAHRVSQPGYVVRIASGCTPQQRDELLKFHEKVISKLSPNFRVHFTPDFAGAAGDDYKYFNKPFGLQHWLQNGFAKKNVEYHDAIIMVLDPDMMLLRPLTYDFTDSNVIIHESKRGAPKVRKVMHGQPWASIYGFGNKPFQVDLKYVFGNNNVTADEDDSPAMHVPIDEQNNNYAGGPPYMATGADMAAIVDKWCEVVTRVHRVLPQSILAEMYGWSLAAAHLRLPHVLAESFMVSDVGVSRGEGWPLVDALDGDEISGYSAAKIEEDKLPYVIHYCQSYWLGKWFIGKYRLASDWMSCEKPLLLEPPRDIGEKYDYYIKPGGVPYGAKVKIPPVIAKRNQFMIHQIIAWYNDAASWLKGQTCAEGTANYEKSFFFHHSLDPDNNVGGEKKPKG